MPRARELTVPPRFGLDAGSYVLVTLHRPSNVDDPEQLAVLLEALGQLSALRPVVFPMHPRTRARVQSWPLQKLLQPLTIVEPLGYAEMVGMLDAAAATVTDSGGGVDSETRTITVNP